MKIASEKCLQCGSDELRAHHVYCDEDTAWRTIDCKDCGFQWNEVYTFSHNEDIVTCAKLDDFPLDI